MKRFFATIFLFSCLVASSGFALNTHYCMGEVDAVSIGSASSDTCGKCGMETTGKRWMLP